MAIFVLLYYFRHMNKVNTKGNLCILFVDDDEDDKEFISQAFHKVTEHCDMHTAENGKQALEYLQNIKDEDALPCLIVLDLNMPVLNGLQTLEELNRKPAFQKIPKVIFTTSDSDEDKKRCLSKGAVDFFVKPSSMTGIIKTVQKMLLYCKG